jgi:hypothetical protein
MAAGGQKRAKKFIQKNLSKELELRKKRKLHNQRAKVKDERKAARAAASTLAGASKTRTVVVAPMDRTGVF